MEGARHTQYQIWLAPCQELDVISADVRALCVFRVRLEVCRDNLYGGECKTGSMSQYRVIIFRAKKK
jgi:hypothetical protein